MTVNNTVPPVVTGTPKQGQTLQTDNGSWTFDLDYLTYAYQWLRCDAAGANCSDIAGATASSYVLQAADIGATVRSEVTATEVSTAPPPVTEPPAIAGQGYSIVFEDDFDTIDTNIWRKGAWYIPESPANYSVSNSIASIFNHPSEHKQRDLMSKGAYKWQYGYFEARMRYTRNIDAWASTWMMSSNWIDTGNCNTLKICEFDMLESNHQYESPLTYRSHFGASHSNTTGACNMADGVSPWSTNWTADTGLVCADQWRTYAGWWTPSSLKWYLDDTLLKTYPTPSTMNQPMRWFLGIWSHNFTTELRVDIDWCRVWQQ